MSVFVRFCVLLSAVAVFCSNSTAADDPRNVRFGSLIPDENYCDQPYVVVTKDGNWLCVLTTGPGVEGKQDQHVVSTISADKGKTWSKLVDIEPSDGWKESSWAVPLYTPGGRVYVFYLYNGDNIHVMPDGDPISQPHALGWYCYKYSDDGGRSWSAERYRLSLPVTACDRANNWGGKVQLFWGIDKPKIIGHSAMFAFTKMGAFQFENGEGWLFRSDNILTESDPTKLHWTLLPDGDHGIRAPEFGSIQEEHNIVPLGDNNLYCVYRTTTGYPCHTYSSDGGHTWTKPEYMTYAPGGRKIKTPRACPRLWRTVDGRFLFWFHNNGGHSFRGRNPAWISGGVLKDGRIHWSQPEIFLYDPDPKVRMSYPDLIEQDGRYWVAETNKSVARVHEIDKSLLEDLWDQGNVKAVAQKGLVLNLGSEAIKRGEVDMSKLPNLAEGGGFAVDFWIKLNELSADQVILDSRDPAGKGFVVKTAKDGAIRIEMNDGENVGFWSCDPNIITVDTWRHVAIIVDGGPNVITYVVDGMFCDGGDARQYGWGRFTPKLGDVTGSGKLRTAPSLKGQLKRLRIYDRYIRTSEAIANFHAGESDISTVPIIFTIDIYHPHADPDDHFDLANIFAMPQFDIRGIVLEEGARQLKAPGRIPLEQMMHLTGRKVPYAIGLKPRLKSPDDECRDQPAEFQKGVAMILDTLRRSDRKVTIFTTGSLRDVAAAFNREPELFRQKVGRLYINIGDAGVRQDYNIDLDMHSWVCIMRSGLPIYWCVCDDGGIYERGRGYATYWLLRKRDVLETIPMELQNYFIYALTKPKGVDPIEFLAKPTDPVAEKRAFDGRFSGPPRINPGLRGMWCTAPFFHAAGLKTVEVEPGRWVAKQMVDTGQREVKTYDFVPVRVAVDDNGKATIDFTGKSLGNKMLIFKLLNPAYDKVMTSCLRAFLEKIPAKK